jgi:DNA-binding NarL/FixJ family response regulator
MTLDLKPDVILLDVNMPGISGLEVTRRIRAENSITKILVMSQHDPVVLVPRAIEAGADACVDKSRLGIDLVSAIAGLKKTADGE